MYGFELHAHEPRHLVTIHTEDHTYEGVFFWPQQQLHATHIAMSEYAEHPS